MLILGNVVFIFKNLFNVYLLFERSRERQRHEQGESQREGDTESEAGSRLWARTHGPQDRDLSRSRTPNRLSHLGAPSIDILTIFVFPIHEHGMFFHFFVSSSIFFISFQHSDLLHLWLGLFLGILWFLVQL